MLYLSEILQQSVWNAIKRHGKLGEDSGAMLLDFYVHKENTSSCCDASPAPLCPARHWETEALRLHSAAKTTRERIKKKKRCLASLPVGDVMSWLCLPGSALHACVFHAYWDPIKWKSRRLEKGLARPSLFFQSFLPFHPAGRAASPLIPPKPGPLVKVLRKQPLFWSHI